MTRRTLHAVLACAFGSVLLATPVQALPNAAPDAPPQVMLAANDCYSVGQSYAARVGGQLARATPQVRGGQTVCVVVVLLPARDGERPRRSEVVLPLG